MARSRKQVYVWYQALAVVVLLGVGYWLYSASRPAPQSSDIFAISAPLTYGDTTLVGTLRKDAPAGKPGHFLLVLPSGQPILLDSEGLDKLLGKKVSAEGYLSPASGDGQGASMAVRTLTPVTP